jgi:prepilin-type processing-associated H-X9-DG protein
MLISEAVTLVLHPEGPHHLVDPDALRRYGTMGLLAYCLMILLFVSPGSSCPEILPRGRTATVPFGHAGFSRTPSGRTSFPSGWAGWPNNLGLGSKHSGGVQVAHADGSVHFVSDSINFAVYRGMASIKGGETAQLP